MNSESRHDYEDRGTVTRTEGRCEALQRNANDSNRINAIGPEKPEREDALRDVST
jgi:hypothetical protein